MNPFSITGRLVDIHNERIYDATIQVSGKKISSITVVPNSELPTPDSGPLTHYILPGFIDSHVHIESSMLVPSEFARLAVVHGTVATVSDPHEIANVCGMQGVEFMIENGKTVPFKFYFGAPSCVPATVFETAGAEINAEGVATLLQRNEIKYLSEMMNFPGVLNGDPEVMKKIGTALRLGKVVDGHAPGLMGEQAKKYIDAGISTDHECFTKEEALDKLNQGMKILIREGSAAKNFEALVELLNDHAGMMMFCSDDKHPDSLVEGHINQLCARAVAKGIDVFKVLRAACINPVHHYKLDVGILRQGDPADFIIVRDLEQFQVLQTYINGELVSENGKTAIGSRQAEETVHVNNFNCRPKLPGDFTIHSLSEKEILSSNWLVDDGDNNRKADVIEALDGQLITNRILAGIEKGEEIIRTSTAEDILKIVVVNRYHDAPVAKALIKNFGLKSGAIASSVAHDSHNIVAVGVDDESICEAVNLIIEKKGGISCVTPANKMILPLPVAGLMSAGDGYEVAAQYSAIDAAAKAAGSTLSSPFMTLSFMALLVIPHLKLSDKGLFDGDKFEIIHHG